MAKGESGLSAVCKALLIAACCASVLSAGLPALTIHMIGVDRDITVLGLSEFFSVMDSFDVNRLLSSLHIAPLLEETAIRVGVLELPAKTVLDAMHLDTLADLTGRLPGITLPIAELARIQTLLRLMMAGAVLALAFAHWRRGAALRAVYGMLLCVGMIAALAAFSHQVDLFHSSLNKTVAKTMAITLDSLRIRYEAWGVYVSGMALYSLFSLCQCAGNALRKRKENRLA
jgi:hypothetical protein